MTHFYLKNHACHEKKSLGRRFAENKDTYRNCFQRDKDRIVHSRAFRKLGYKTQVFTNYEGDYYRTRLTHTLEVSQISRSIARILGLQEDLVEVIALAHDLGHPPFGHAGEESLAKAMQTFGGFNHNVQSFKIVTLIEKSYAEFDGLNLTWEALEGIIKHNGPILNNPHEYISHYNNQYDLKIALFSSAEGQIAAISDDITYITHDIDDGIRANIFTINDLKQLPIIHGIIEELLYKYPKITYKDRLIYEILRHMTTVMINDVVYQFERNIANYNIETIEDIRNLSYSIAHFSPEMTETMQKLKDFLYNNMYKYYRINRLMAKGKKIIDDLFNFLYNNPNCLPNEWKSNAENASDKKRAEIVCDFISGMTDRYAISEYCNIFNITSFNLF